MTKPRILIADDEPFNIDYLEQELEALDYDTLAAANGQEALFKTRSEAPDLILLDIMMPVMDGFQVLSHLKADPATRDIPVIVISATTDLRSVVRGIELGAEDYLPKPFEPTLLRARISSSLEKKRLRDLQQLYLKSLERELEIGRRIQTGFLPSELPQVDGWEIAAYFQAAREVAGDFYDAFLLPDGNLVVVVGDVCGKGVGAALFMTLFRSLIRATSTTDYLRRPGEVQALTAAQRLQHVVSFTNSYIAETHGSANMYAAIFIGIISLQGGTLAYINGGNEPPLLLGKEGAVTALRRTGPVVGALPEAQFAVKEVSMQKGDYLLIFTDGIPDSTNAVEEFFGNDRLTAALDNRSLTAAGMVSRLDTEVHDFIGTAEQFDDITLLAVRMAL